MADPKSYIEKVEADLIDKEQKADEKSKQAEKIKYILIGVLLGVWLIGLLVLTGFRYIPNRQYVSAIKEFENGNLKEAASAFEKMDGLGSSEYYLEKIYLQFPQYKLINAEVGEMVSYGMYNQEQNVAPIEWYVIAKEGNKVLLLSKHIIDAQPYSGEMSLPTWLEETFKKSAFSDNESIAVSEIVILNKSQIATYVEGKPFAACVPTSFAISRGYWASYSGEYMWWTGETSSSKKHFVAYPSGSVGQRVSDDSEMNGVRPAIWVSFE